MHGADGPTVCWSDRGKQERQSTPETTGCCVYVWGTEAEGAWVLTLGTQVSRSYHEGGFEAVTQLESAWVKLSGCVWQGEKISNANSPYANFGILFSMDVCIHYDF